jgi:uncharacterized protein (TIGR02611 family)
MSDKKNIKRVLVMIGGGLVLLAGIAMLILPGPAFLVIPLGFAILATEFDWAKRWLAAAKELFSKNKEEQQAKKPFFQRMRDKTVRFFRQGMGREPLKNQNQ